MVERKQNFLRGTMLWALYIYVNSFNPSFNSVIKKNSYRNKETEAEMDYVIYARKRGRMDSEVYFLHMCSFLRKWTNPAK